MKLKCEHRERRIENNLIKCSTCNQVIQQLKKVDKSLTQDEQIRKILP